MSLTLREKLLATFDNPVYNNFTTAQAAARFRVSPSTVNKAVRSLRLDGHAIFRNTKNYDGRKISIYKLGKPSKAYRRAMRAGRTEEAIEALNR